MRAHHSGSISSTMSCSRGSSCALPAQPWVSGSLWSLVSFSWRVKVRSRDLRATCVCPLLLECCLPQGFSERGSLFIFTPAYSHTHICMGTWILSHLSSVSISLGPLTISMSICSAPWREPSSQLHEAASLLCPDIMLAKVVIASCHQLPLPPCSRVILAPALLPALVPSRWLSDWIRKLRKDAKLSFLN